MGDPLASLLTVRQAASAEVVAGAIANAIAFPRAAVPPPAWLRPEQCASFARARAALDRFGLALLAEPVGSGKSWIALALAGAEPDRRLVTAIVPAALVDQWRSTAELAGVPLRLWTHERISRGRLPQTRSGLVIIDESHRFRTAETRRYRTIAPWLLGRRLLLLTATPVVNRLEDLSRQLLLGLPDDGLKGSGLGSIEHDLPRGIGAHCLGEVVIASMPEAIGGPARRDSTISLPHSIPAELMMGLDGLTNSRRRSVARLLEGVLWFAAASSPAALLAVLTRYRTLLTHAEDARIEGRHLTRAELREFTGVLGEQTAMWSVLAPQAVATDEFDLDDLARVDEVLPLARAWCTSGDLKRERLRQLLAGGGPTLVFTSSRATVRYLRDWLEPAVAWSIGGRAGLGHSELPREVVWRWFAPDSGWDGAGSRPSTLVCTDVAAEGLNLQRSARVIHYDLPWTPMRLAQRDGRAIRMGSLHDTVDVIRFLPAAPLERRLGIARLISTKLRLPDQVGLGSEGRRLWRWRDAFTIRPENPRVPGGISAIEGAGVGPGALVGVALMTPGSEPNRALALWLPTDGEPTEAADEVEPRLRIALAAETSAVPERYEVDRILARLWPVVRSRLAASEEVRWRGRRLTPQARQLARRLHHLLGRAARQRDAVALAAIERGLSFAGRGHRAGEAMLLLRLLTLSDRHLLEQVQRLPQLETKAPVVVPRIDGVLVFR